MVLKTRKEDPTMPSVTLKGPESIPQETQPSNMPRLPSEKVTAVQQEALASEDHSRSPTFHRWFERLGAPSIAARPEVAFSEDQYSSSTYHHWFERHIGLSLDEALALGLAKREHAST
jgi:hypothetical protein